MDPKEVRKALGLPEDASDTQVHEALLQRSGLVPAGEGAPAEPVAPAATPQGDPVVPQPVAQQPVPAPVVQVPEPVAASGVNLPPGTVLIDEATWAQTQAGLARVNTLVEKDAENERNTLVAAAVGDGRIPPARKDHWVEYLKVDPEGGKAALASLKPNIVPITERGHAVTPQNDEPLVLEAETVASWSEQLFPEVRTMRAQDRAAAAGEPVRRSRITADASYRR